MTNSVLIMSRKGGVSKSTLSILIADASDANGTEKKLVDADVPTSTGPANSIKGASFSTVFRDRVQKFVISPDMESIKQDANVLVQHWYPLFDSVVAGNALIDFGAGINQPFFAAWQAASMIDEVEETSIDIVVPTTVNPEALVSCLQTVQQALEQIPTARVFVALSEKEGKFERFESHPVIKDLQELKSRGVMFFKIHKCTSTLWAPTELAGMSFRSVLSTAKDQLPELAQNLGMSARDARLGIGELANWYCRSVETLKSVGLI